MKSVNVSRICRRKTIFRKIKIWTKVTQRKERVRHADMQIFRCHTKSECVCLKSKSIQPLLFHPRSKKQSFFIRAPSVYVFRALPLLWTWRFSSSFIRVYFPMLFFSSFLEIHRYMKKKRILPRDMYVYWLLGQRWRMKKKIRGFG